MKKTFLCLFFISCKVSAAVAASDYLTLWNRLAQETPAKELQPGCEPRRYPVNAGVPRIGTAILIHGYTACPQQYFEIAEMLAAGGVEVLLPIMPGHGLTMNDDGSDDNSELPGRYSYERYTQFARRLNQIAAKAPGMKMIAGLSGGGGVAAEAMNLAPDLYDRVALFAPWFHAEANFWEGLFLWLARNLPLGLWQKVPWGEACLREREAGRTGYCESYISNVAAAESFGRKAFRALGRHRAQVQIVGVESDPAVDVPTIVRAALRMGSKVDLCFEPEGIPHSFFAPLDNVESNPTWIPAFRQNLFNFAVHGTNFTTEAPSSVVGYRQCQTH